ncbi:hypothetical protein Bbelb_283290 [Branchiostoma belcheri]|nr:hypothetical protein Bbelb_283290 [Branchiostoma belcheri]
MFPVEYDVYRKDLLTVKVESSITPEDLDKAFRSTTSPVCGGNSVGGTPTQADEWLTISLTRLTMEDRQQLLWQWLSKKHICDQHLLKEEFPLVDAAYQSQQMAECIQMHHIGDHWAVSCTLEIKTGVTVYGSMYTTVGMSLCRQLVSLYKHHVSVDKGILPVTVIRAQSVSDRWEAVTGLFAIANAVAVTTSKLNNPPLSQRHSPLVVVGAGDDILQKVEEIDKAGKTVEKVYKDPKPDKRRVVYSSLLAAVDSSQPKMSFGRGRGKQSFYNRQQAKGKSDQEATRLGLEAENQKWVILEVLPVEGQFLSPLFLVPKKDGTWRPVVNPKPLNQSLRYLKSLTWTWVREDMLNTTDPNDSRSESSQKEGDPPTPFPLNLNHELTFRQAVVSIGNQLKPSLFRASDQRVLLNPTLDDIVLLYQTRQQPAIPSSTSLSGTSITASLHHGPNPYVTAQREVLGVVLGVSEDQPASAIDVFKAHRCPELLAKVKENHTHAVYVPAIENNTAIGENDVTADTPVADSHNREPTESQLCAKCEGRRSKGLPTGPAYHDGCTQTIDKNLKMGNIDNDGKILNGTNEALRDAGLPPAEKQDCIQHNTRNHRNRVFPLNLKCHPDNDEAFSEELAHLRSTLGATHFAVLDRLPWKPLTKKRTITRRGNKALATACDVANSAKLIQCILVKTTPRTNGSTMEAREEVEGVPGPNSWAQKTLSCASDARTLRISYRSLKEAASNVAYSTNVSSGINGHQPTSSPDDLSENQELCDFCINHEYTGPTLSPIPRPYPDYDRLPTFHYQPYNKTPIEGRLPDDFQPRAQLKSAVNNKTVTIDDVQSIHEFSQKYIVSVEHVKEYIEHIRLIHTMKVKGAALAEDKRRECEENKYDEYDWETFVKTRSSLTREKRNRI